MADKENWSDIWGNVLPSAGRFASNIYQAVRHPVDTAKNLGQVALGGGEYALHAVAPQTAMRLRSLMPQQYDAAAAKARNLGGFYAERYGSPEAIRHTIITDPVGAAADLATLATGVGGAARGVAGVSGALGAEGLAGTSADIARGAVAVADYSDPLSISGKLGRSTPLTRGVTNAVSGTASLPGRAVGNAVDTVVSQGVVFAVFPG